MIFVAPTGTKTSTLKTAMGLLKKQVNLHDQQDVSSTASCSDSERSDTDCIVESLKASSLKLLSSDSNKVAAASASAAPPALSARKRRARFALGRSQIFYVTPLEEISAIERQDCWWGHKDFQAFIFSAKHSSHEARIVGGSNVVKAIDDGYNTATYLARMQEHNMERELAEHKIVKFTAGLEAWACQPNSYRGLEHWTSAKFFRARIGNMEEAKDVVMQLTHRQESAEEIAKHYQESSRAARILARLRGHADYEASVAVVLKEEELAAAAQFIAY